MKLQGAVARPRAPYRGLRGLTAAFQSLGDNQNNAPAGVKDVSFQPLPTDSALKPCGLKKFLPPRSISGIVRAGLLAGLKNQAVQILRVQLRLHVR